MAILLAGAALMSAPAEAQDAARGARLYTNTADVVGKSVASCAGCHADVRGLRELIRNRGGRSDDFQALVRWLNAVFSGAHPGAANAMAQYQGVLTAVDVRDLAAYIAEAKRAARRTSRLAVDRPAAKAGGVS